MREKPLTMTEVKLLSDIMYDNIRYKDPIIRVRQEPDMREKIKKLLFTDYCGRMAVNCENQLDKIVELFDSEKRAWLKEILDSYEEGYCDHIDEIKKRGGI